MTLVEKAAAAIDASWEHLIFTTRATTALHNDTYLFIFCRGVVVTAGDHVAAAWRLHGGLVVEFVSAAKRVMAPSSGPKGSQEINIRSPDTVPWVLKVWNPAGTARAINVALSRMMFYHVDRVTLASLLFPDSAQQLKALAQAMFRRNAQHHKDVNPLGIETPQGEPLVDSEGLMDQEAVLLVVDGCLLTTHRLFISTFALDWDEIAFMELLVPSWHLKIHAERRKPHQSLLRVTLRTDRSQGEWLLTLWLDHQAKRAHKHLKLQGQAMRRLHSRFSKARVSQEQHLLTREQEIASVLLPLPVDMATCFAVTGEKDAVGDLSLTFKMSFPDYVDVVAQLFSNDFATRLRFVVTLVDGNRDGHVSLKEWSIAVRILQRCNDAVPDSATDAAAEAMFRAAFGKVKAVPLAHVMNVFTGASRRRLVVIGAASERGGEEGGDVLPYRRLASDEESKTDHVSLSYLVMVDSLLMLSKLWNRLAADVQMAEEDASKVQRGAYITKQALRIRKPADTLPTSLLERPLSDTSFNVNASFAQESAVGGVHPTQIDVELCEPLSMFQVSIAHGVPVDSFDAAINIGALIQSSFIAESLVMVKAKEEDTAFVPRGQQLAVFRSHTRLFHVAEIPEDLALLWCEMMKALTHFAPANPNHLLPRVFAILKVTLHGVALEATVVKPVRSTSQQGRQRPRSTSMRATELPKRVDQPQAIVNAPSSSTVVRWLILAQSREGELHGRWDYPVGHAPWQHLLASANLTRTVLSAPLEEFIDENFAGETAAQRQAPVVGLDRGWRDPILQQIEVDSVFASFFCWKLYISMTVVTTTKQPVKRMGNNANRASPSQDRPFLGANEDDDNDGEPKAATNAGGGCCSKSSVAARPQGPNNYPPTAAAPDGRSMSSASASHQHRSLTSLKLANRTMLSPAVSPVTAGNQIVLIEMQLLELTRISPVGPPKPNLAQRQLIPFNAICRAAVIESQDVTTAFFLSHPPSLKKNSTTVIFDVDLPSGEAGFVVIDRAAKALCVMTKDHVIRAIQLKPHCVHIARPLLPVLDTSRTLAAICADFDPRAGRHRVVVPIRMKGVADTDELNVEVHRNEVLPSALQGTGWFTTVVKIIVTHWCLGPVKNISDIDFSALFPDIGSGKQSGSSLAPGLVVISTTDNPFSIPDESGRDLWLEALRSALDAVAREDARTNGDATSKEYSVIGDAFVEGHRVLAFADHVTAPRVCSVRTQTAALRESSTDRLTTVITLSMRLDTSPLVFVSLGCPASTVGLAIDAKLELLERLIAAGSSAFRASLGMDILNAHNHQFLLGELNFGWGTPKGGSEKKLRRAQLMPSTAHPTEPSVDRSKEVGQIPREARDVVRMTPHALKRFDLLQILMSEGECLAGFEEPMPSFEPTCTFVPETQGNRVYDANAAIPGHWNTRILVAHQSHRLDANRRETYRKVCPSRTSTHDAVSSLFSVAIRNRFVKKKEPRGYLCIKLLVAELSCYNLAAADGSDQLSDPFVRFICPMFVKDGATPPQMHTIHPVWHDVFELDVDPVEPEALNSAYMTCIIADIDLVGAPEPLGEAVLSLELVDPTGMTETALSAPVIRNGMLRGTLSAKIRFVVVMQTA